MSVTDPASKEALFNTFEPSVITVPRPSHHYAYLVAPNGDWLASADGETLCVQGFVDDRAIWNAVEGGFEHVRTGLTLSASSTATGTTTTLELDGRPVGDDGSPGEAAEFGVGHGPERLPSDYLATLEETGWVSLTCVLPPSVVDGLQRVGCVDGYEERTPEKRYPLVQDPAVARATAEPVSLWLTREYMHTRDIRLGHSPGVSALPPDDGEREVQGWHTDFPYLWGTGDRIPLPSGDLVLGMQRNVCVSDFRVDNGATLFRLGSHRSNAAPPREWGITTDTYKPGHRDEFGLPYGGPESAVIEAPAGTIILYDARTWHRAGVNRTEHKRGAMIQAIVPAYIIPFMDTSATFKALLESDAYQVLTEREQKELDKLMVHKIVGPAGMFAITVDEDLTDRARAQLTPSA